MSTVPELTAKLRQDGFVFFRNFFPPEQVAQARQELLRWFELDRLDRERTSVRKYVHKGAAGESRLSASTHLLIDVYGKSPTLDRMVDRLLTDPVAAAVLGKMAGPRLKLRGYNIRFMTGAYDPSPAHPGDSDLPHPWHRDWPGEVGISLLLTDLPSGGNSGTALLPGSHLFPYAPQRHTLFSNSYTLDPMLTPGYRWPTRLAIANHRLARRLLPNAVEAAGKAGDFMYFFNDTWHGRYPNLHGRQAMVLFIGAFPTEFPFPDEVATPPDDVLRNLPESIRSRVKPPAHTPVPDHDSILYWMLRERGRAAPFGLFWWAQLERRWADLAGWLTLTPTVGLYRLLKQTARRVLRAIRPERSAAPATAATTETTRKAA